MRCETSVIWPEEIIPRLQLLGEVLVNALARRNAEHSLRESEERLSLAAASAEAGFWTLDPGTGKYLGVRPAAGAAGSRPGRRV